MAIFSFLTKRPKHRKFDYQTRYLDLEKEERIKKFGDHSNKGSKEAEDIKERIRNGLRTQKTISSTPGFKQPSSSRLIFWVIVIGGLVFLMVNGPTLYERMKQAPITPSEQPILDLDDLNN